MLTDVANSYRGPETNAQVVQLYKSGYLKQAADSRDISQYAYKRGAASLLDFLDAERSYRSTELAYRDALANYMLPWNVAPGGGHKEPAMRMHRHFSNSRRREHRYRRSGLCAAVGAAILLAGCGGTDQASKMTSFSTAATAADQADERLAAIQAQGET